MTTDTREERKNAEGGTQGQMHQGMRTVEQMEVSVTMNGPYVVKGSVPLARQIIEPNDLGESWTWHEGEQFKRRETYRLCRCGGSGHKPFCDGTHLKNGFDGTEYEVRNRVTLRRCGASQNKPFCNGSHASIDFDDGRIGAKHYNLSSMYKKYL